LKVKLTVWRNVSAVKRYKPGTDSLADFRFSNYRNAENNTQHMFKVIRLDRPKIELCQIFDLSNEKKDINLVSSQNNCFVLEHLDR